jgi:hypothetical protein
MKYICEIDVAYSEEDPCVEYYCGKECPWKEAKENKSGDSFPFCNVFQKKLKLDWQLYELPAILRCAECCYAFYRAPEALEGI